MITPSLMRAYFVNGMAVFTFYMITSSLMANKYMSIFEKIMITLSLIDGIL